MNPSVENRFWAKVDKSGECWVWTARRHSFGYGEFSNGGQKVRAHRASYELAYGPVPDGLYVLHRCDNPPCVRPDHLFLGSQTDNLRDMARKGRGNAPGEGNQGHKLTWIAVRAIRAAYSQGVARRELANQYGVSTSLIDGVVNNQRWREVA